MAEKVVIRKKSGLFLKSKNLYLTQKYSPHSGNAPSCATRMRASIVTNIIYNWLQKCNEHFIVRIALTEDFSQFERGDMKKINA